MRPLDERALDGLSPGRLAVGLYVLYAALLGIAVFTVIWLF
jgi:hypothetical protein